MLPEAGPSPAPTKLKPGPRQSKRGTERRKEGGLFGRAPVGYYDLLRTFWEGLSIEVVAKNGHIYSLREKENGFKELVFYNATWR